ncbi:leucine-rich repeat-containing protein (substrate of the Dot/Icm secretion system) (plasmid) [Legionella adelaidensis]|uniref:Leucine-rich repeat-containing protein n=1 Tax=Legionella adelaidensis TaxID=45056 RepID=A0A0W0R4Z3_9GAMM|nr:hypothetical protein [Legionella adelaidensis]KTC66103.1 leucine-rich repeat-containing protein [Legionella adelaidensis]VEH85827.1 leucine-rich repeat-containing protein (substrate of the Dot/Icm secretion system) [Legionella adelaidensis]
MPKNKHYECYPKDFNSAESYYCAFQAIPKGTNSLSLFGIQLGLLAEDVALDLFNNLSPEIRELSLAKNGFGDQPVAHLQRILSNRRSIVGLDISWNNLGNHNGRDLSTALAGLSCLNELNLGWNELCLMETQDLALFLAQLNDSINKVILAGNNLSKKSGSELATIISSIKSAKILDLSENDLGSLIEIDLDQAFAAIGSNVQFLIFRGNNIGTHTRNNLGTVLSKLPQNIIALDLQANNLPFIPLENLSKFKNSAPFIKEIYLSKEELERMPTESWMATKNIFPNLERIYLIDNAQKITTLNFRKRIEILEKDSNYSISLSR